MILRRYANILCNNVVCSINFSLSDVKYNKLLYSILQMATEFFDDKLLSIGYATFGVLETRNLTLDDFVFLEALTNIGTQIVI